MCMGVWAFVGGCVDPVCVSASSQHFMKEPDGVHLHRCEFSKLPAATSCYLLSQTKCHIFSPLLLLLLSSWGRQIVQFIFFSFQQQNLCKTARHVDFKRHIKIGFIYLFFVIVVHMRTRESSCTHFLCVIMPVFIDNDDGKDLTKTYCRWFN